MACSPEQLLSTKSESGFRQANTFGDLSAVRDPRQDQESADFAPIGRGDFLEVGGCCDPRGDWRARLRLLASLTVHSLRWA
jgi:hypothetical protein